MNAVVNAAEGNDLRLVVETTAKEATLNESQKALIADKDVERTFEAYFVSNGKRIASFDGGEIQVGVVEFKVPAGKEAKYFHVEYLPKSGEAERHVTRYENGFLYFNTGHFSDYAIVYDESEENATEVKTEEPDVTKPVKKVKSKKVYRLYNAASGKHLFTTAKKEKNALVKAGWKSEGVAFKTGGKKLVYRLSKDGGHVITMSEKEVQKLRTSGWTYEGIAFKAN